MVSPDFSFNEVLSLSPSDYLYNSIELVEPTTIVFSDIVGNFDAKSYKFFELTENTVGEGRISILFDGCKYSDEDGNEIIFPETTATASLYHIYIDEWNVWHRTHIADFDQLEDQILLSSYNDQWPFLQFSGDISEYLDGRIETQVWSNGKYITQEFETYETVVLEISGTAINTPLLTEGASGQALITFGLPNGQRAQQWGTDWLACDKEDNGEPNEDTVLETILPVGHELQPLHTEVSEGNSNGYSSKKYSTQTLEEILQSEESFNSSGWDDLMNDDGCDEFGIVCGPVEYLGQNNDTTPFWKKMIGGFAAEAFLVWAQTTTELPKVNSLIGIADTTKDAEDFRKNITDGFSVIFENMENHSDSENFEEFYEKQKDTILKQILESVPVVSDYLAPFLNKTNFSEVSYSDDDQSQQFYMYDQSSEISFDQIKEISSLQFLGSTSNDTVVGTSGEDKLFSLLGNDSITSGAGNDLIDLGSGNDTGLGEDGDDTLSGGEGDDVIAGGNGKDSLIGGEGNDQIAASIRSDFVDGGSGDDRIGGGLGDDSINGGDGDDTIGSGKDNDTVDAGDGNDIVAASFGDDFIDGGAGNDSLAGHVGADLIIGRTGHDNIGGGYGDDTIKGGAGYDTIGAGQQDDVVYGATGDDVLNGNNGNDTIDGGDGNDIIAGGDHNDVMTGGNGADVFRFRVFNAGTEDIITDFTRGEDTLEMRGNFSGLSITDHADGIQIEKNGHVIVLEGVETVTADDFIFV